MITNAKPLKCGCCGKDDVKLYTTDESSHGGMTEIIIECQGCKSVTHILPTRASFHLEWGSHNSEGIMTIME